MGGAVNGLAQSFNSKNIETFHIKSIRPSNQAWVDSDCAVNANTILRDDSITPHRHLDTPVRVQINGDLSVGSSDRFAESVNSNWHVKIKYLEAAAGAINIQIGASPDLAILAILNNRKTKVDRIGKSTSNKATIADSVGPI